MGSMPLNGSSSMSSFGWDERAVISSRRFSPLSV
jgi:hypothetical protein